MKHIIFILLALLMLSCKAPQKTVTNSKLDQQTHISNDITLNDDKHLKELTDQVIRRLINERLNIDIKQVKYDTDKPVDSATGKPPVAEETDINISRDTEVNETDSTHQEADSLSNIQLIDKTNTDIKTKTVLKEEKKTGLNTIQKILMAIGGCVVIGFIVFVIIKIKK